MLLALHVERARRAVSVEKLGPHTVHRIRVEVVHWPDKDMVIERPPEKEHRDHNKTGSNESHLQGQEVKRCQRVRQSDAWSPQKHSRKHLNRGCGVSEKLRPKVL